MSRAPALIPIRSVVSVAIGGALARARKRRQLAAPKGTRRRIMHVVLNLHVGGLERVVLDLVRNLDRAKYDVEVCCLDDGGVLQQEFEPLGVQVTALGMSEVGGGVVLERLAARMSDQAVDVVNTHNVLAHKFGAIAARCAGVPVVVHTKHGRNFVRRPFEHPKIQVYGHLLSWISDKVVAVSDDTSAVCRKYELVPPRKLVTIANGVDVSRFDVRADRAELLRDLGIPVDAQIVGNVARLVPEKDHANLVNAFATVLATIPRAYLLLVGEGPLMDATARICADRGVADRVKFAGSRRDVPQLLKLFDVFVLSSATEGMSISLLEAMSAGLPVVATIVGGNPEIVEHGVTGLLCPAHDSEALAARIVDVLCNRELGRSLAVAARERVLTSYSMQRTAIAYMSLYEELLARKSR